MEVGQNVPVQAIYDIVRNLSGFAILRHEGGCWEPKQPDNSNRQPFGGQEIDLSIVGSYRQFTWMVMLILAYSFFSAQGSAQRARGSSDTTSSAVRRTAQQQSSATDSTSFTTVSSVEMKRSDSNYFPEDSDDDDDVRRHDSRYTNNTGSTTGAGRLACPYFKRSPQTYQNCQSCRGPGWRTVHHVKGHLYRRHRQQAQCKRCYLTFNDLQALNEHQKMLPRCEAKEGIPVEGFDHDQETKLRSRKRKSIKSSEAERWREMYQILFPNDDPASLPSPYYDEDYFEKPAKWSNPNLADPVVDFAAYSQQHLPGLISHQLDQLSTASQQPITEDLKAHLLHIVRSSQAKLLPSFQQKQQGADPLQLTTPTNPPPYQLTMPSAMSSQCTPSSCYMQQQQVTSIPIHLSEDEPALGFSDASKNSSSDSLATLANGNGLDADTGLIGSFDSWILQKSIRTQGTRPENQHNIHMDLNMSDFLDFDANVLPTEDELAILENGAPSDGLFIL